MAGHGPTKSYTSPECDTLGTERTKDTQIQRHAVSRQTAGYKGRHDPTITTCDWWSGVRPNNSSECRFVEKEDLGDQVRVQVR